MVFPFLLNSKRKFVKEDLCSKSQVTYKWKWLCYECDAHNGKQTYIRPDEATTMKKMIWICIKTGFSCFVRQTHTHRLTGDRFHINYENTHESHEDTYHKFLTALNCLWQCTYSQYNVFMFECIYFFFLRWFGRCWPHRSIGWSVNLNGNDELTFLWFWIRECLTLEK